MTHAIANALTNAGLGLLIISGIALIGPNLPSIIRALKGA